MATTLQMHRSCRYSLSTDKQTPRENELGAVLCKCRAGYFLHWDVYIRVCLCVCVHKRVYVHVCRFYSRAQYTHACAHTRTKQHKSILATGSSPIYFLLSWF